MIRRCSANKLDITQLLKPISANELKSELSGRKQSKRHGEDGLIQEKDSLSSSEILN